MRSYLDILEGLVLPLLIVATPLAYRTTKTAVRRWGTGPARAWPTISAVIEVVSVSQQIREGGYGSVETTGYLATLTYFYRNPDLQVGEYTRSFPLEAAAKRWAEGYKNRNILVHINPKDAGDSVLMKDDLEALENSAPSSLEDSLSLEELPQLARSYLVLSGISEFIALIGLALALAGAWMQRNDRSTKWLTVTLISLVLFNCASAWIVAYRADDSNRYQAFLHAYTLFCPAWMRWGVKITGGLLFAVWLVSDLRDLLPPPAQHWLALESTYFMYLFAMWIFFSTGATHAAILRSQELAHRRTVAEPV